MRSTAVSSASASANRAAGAVASAGAGAGAAGALGTLGGTDGIGSTGVTDDFGVSAALCASDAHALHVTHAARHATTVRRTAADNAATRTESPRIVCFEHAMSKTIRASVKPGSARVQ